jgi:hypothetical protein
VLLQAAGLAHLPRRACAPRPRDLPVGAGAAPGPPRGATLDICMIGHLRAEKDPLTFMRAAALVPRRACACCTSAARSTRPAGRGRASHAAANPRYRWLGALPHAPRASASGRCHAMAICLAHGRRRQRHHRGGHERRAGAGLRHRGNRGMLGEDYAGYFRPATPPRWRA